MLRNLAVFHKVRLGEDRIAELKARYGCTVVRVEDFDILKDRKVLYAENRHVFNTSLYPVTGVEAYMKRVNRIDHLNVVGHFRELYMTRVNNGSLRILKGEWEPNMRGNNSTPELFLRMRGQFENNGFIMQDLITIDVKLANVQRYPTHGTYPAEL